MIVVTGATGNVGGALVRTLAAAGEETVAVARRPARASLPAGVRAVSADLEDPASLDGVVDGADAVFLLVAGDPDAVVARVRAGGARRIVLLSSLGVGTRPETYRHPAAFEAAVRHSGLATTVLRPGGFHTNALAWAASVRAERTVRTPFPDVALPTVDPADIADVAVAALREPHHDGRTYALTGPRPTTPRERARAIGEALDEPVTLVEQTRDEAAAEMSAFMPPEVVEGTLAILGEPLAAEVAVSDDVERVLHRPPRSFAGWAARRVDAFR